MAVGRDQRAEILATTYCQPSLSVPISARAQVSSMAIRSAAFHVRWSSSQSRNRGLEAFEPRGTPQFLVEEAGRIGPAKSAQTRHGRLAMHREDVVILTKVCNLMRPGSNSAGLSCKMIGTEIDASLKRLSTDYVDVYMIHRWDYATPFRKNAGGAKRCRQGGQGALSGRLVDVGMAILQGDPDAEGQWRGAVRGDAGPPEPAVLRE